MRRTLNFAVEGKTCAASLDEAAGTHGLLIVSGGNEIRSGAHRGMARLAAAVAAAGHPVLRFDRRGVGDSEGDNLGFEHSGKDIAAAIDAFYDQCPNMCTVTAFGNCDAATALLLQQPQPDSLCYLLLSNPWTIDADKAVDDQPGLPSARAIRARYFDKLRDLAEWKRLLSGGVDLRKLGRGLTAAIHRPPVAPCDMTLASRVVNALHSIDDRNIAILLADGDRTADAFSELWNGPACAEVRKRPWVRTHRHSGGSHSFADAEARAWLEARVLAALLPIAENEGSGP